MYGMYYTSGLIFEQVGKDDTGIRCSRRETQAQQARVCPLSSHAIHNVEKMYIKQNIGHQKRTKACVVLDSGEQLYC